MALYTKELGTVVSNRELVCFSFSRERPKLVFSKIMYSFSYLKMKSISKNKKRNLELFQMILRKNSGGTSRNTVTNIGKR
jgi:hypothetical protein